MTRSLPMLTRVSSLAIAAALTASAFAQSFEGTPTVTYGSVNISEGVGTTDFDVLSTTAVIDWTPDDNLVGNFGAINFQSSGTTATYSSSSDFAVLNRINVADPTRLLFMDGTINSLVSGQTGGSIYFYSPSGFVIGANAVINVGSLVLSASPIAVDGSGNFINGTSVTFNQAVNPDALINTVAGSQINANGTGSYVALVAPQVTHHGTIRTDTAAALVAAEAATISFSPDGLFNIQVTIGTDAGTGVHIDGGTITRNNAAEGASNHHAYLVAVAKNDAVTMLINNGGSVGFDTATSAQNGENNSVILSGGYDVLSGDHWTTSGVSQVDLTITNASFSSDVDAQVTGGAAINSGDGALTFDGNLSIVGGETTTTGGNVLIDALNGNALTISGDLYARAFRRTADGSQTGLITRLGAENGSTVTIGGDVTLDSDSFGASAIDNGFDGADAIGGNAQINIGANSTLNVAGSVYVHADGYGGQNFYSDGAAGDGIGGQALIMSINGGATVNIDGAVIVSAQGYGGSAGECSVCNIVGGNGIGGNASVHTNAGVNSLTLGSDVSISAAGYGGAGDAQAGAGVGGTANLAASDGSTLTVAADADVDASGFGGYGFENVGGLGMGGSAHFGVNVGSASIGGDLFVTAAGVGGSSFNTGSTGGDGTGGNAQIYVSTGDIDIAGSATVAAPGEGGEAIGGTGGDATGGRTGVGTDGGNIHVVTDLVMDGGAIGGDGDVGGDAVGLVSNPPDEAGPIAVAVHTGTGGSITVDGNTILSAQAEGGQGANGNGGNASAGEVDVVAFFGDISLNSLAISVSAYGGDGGNGGNGGDALAGNVDVAFGLGAAAVGGTITLGSAFILADGFGGAGGAGEDANFGGNGGAGGDGTGGNVVFVGSAAGGTLDSGAAIITARGEGGAGGAGGNGDSGTGGAGGSGGIGQGGFIQTGTISADLAPGSGGGANYTTLSIDTSGFGGLGGNGGTGGAGDGIGGNGGDAFGGITLFLARGVLVTADDVQLFASANGGNAGIGSVDGNGGDATTGSIAVESKDRFGHPTQRGTLEVNSITGSAIAIGGTGAVDGLSSALGGSYFRVLNGDATIGSLSFTITGDVHDPSNGPNIVSMRDGAATIDSISFVTSGELVLDASNGSMTADTVLLSAGTFVPDTFNPTPPTSPGTYFANSFDITTGGDFITNANLESATSLSLSAPGLIDMTDAASGGDLTLAAGGSIGGGSLTAAGFVDASSGGDLTLADITAGTDVLLDSAGLMSLGNVIAQAGSVQASAVDVLSFLSISAGTFVTIDPIAIIGGDVTALAGDVNMTGDSIDIGNVSASDNVILTALAGDLLTGNIDAGLNVSLDAAGAVGTGNIAAFGTVDISGSSIAIGDVSGSTLNFISSIGDIAVGDLIAFSSLTVNSAGDFLFGSIFAPLVDLNAPGSIIGGDIDSETDITAVAGADIDVGDLSAGGFTGEGFVDGSVALSAGGDINTGSIDAYGSVMANAGGGIATGDVDALTLIDLLAVGDVATGNLNGTDIDLESGTGDIGFADVDADSIDFDAAGAVSGGNIIASSFAVGSAGGAISLGNITVGPGMPPVDEFSVGFESATSISVGNVSGADRVGFATLGDLVTGNLSAGNLIMALVGGDISVGSMTTTNPGGQVYLADAQMYLDAGGAEDNFDASLVLALDPVPTGGSITINGPVSTGTFRAAAGSDLTAGAIDASDFLWLLSGGDILTGPISAGGYIEMVSGGGIATGDLDSGEYIDLLAAGDIVITAANAAQYFDIESSGGGITIGDVIAGDAIEIRADGGDINVGNLSAGIANPFPDGEYHIAVVATAGSVDVASASALDDVAMAASGDLTAGDIDAGGRFLGLAGGNMNLQSIATGAQGQVLLGDYSMIALGGDLGEGYDIEAVFSADPVPNGGSITINGSVSTGLFRAAAGSNLTASALNAQRIEASAGGLATINGIWSAPFVQLWSNDIAIGANGGIDGGAAGLIELVSTNATQALIGDGLTGTGYQLSNTEFSKLSAGNIYIVARGDASAAIDMLIGNLDVTGPLAGSSLEDPNGALVFATGDAETQVAGGVIRIVGELSATGFTDSNAIEFYTGRFELDAETGLLQITGTGSELSGELYIEADRIHVASGTILDQLAIDPQYSGYQDDLNAPADVQRPDGVIRAGSIDVFPTEAVLVQNTGTAETPAGFLTYAGGPLFGDSEAPIGPIELIINGQLITETGVLTGIDVRDFLIDETNIGLFTANSTINGCPLAGPCGAVEPPEPPVPPDFQPSPGIQHEIALANNNLLPPPDFGNEDFIDDNDEETEEGATSPIEPPDPLFDTRELGEEGEAAGPEVGTSMRSTPGLTEPGDVDDPVSGSGNPALMEPQATPPSGQENQQ